MYIFLMCVSNTAMTAISSTIALPKIVDVGNSVASGIPVLTNTAWWLEMAVATPLGGIMVGKQRVLIHTDSNA